MVIRRIAYCGQSGGAGSAPCVAPSDGGVQAMLFANRVLPRPGHAVTKLQICLMGSILLMDTSRPRMGRLPPVRPTGAPALSPRSGCDPGKRNSMCCARPRWYYHLILLYVTSRHTGFVPFALQFDGRSTALSAQPSTSASNPARCWHRRCHKCWHAQGSSAQDLVERVYKTLLSRIPCAHFSQPSNTLVHFCDVKWSGRLMHRTRQRWLARLLKEVRVKC